MLRLEDAGVGERAEPAGDPGVAAMPQQRRQLALVLVGVHDRRVYYLAQQRRALRDLRLLPRASQRGQQERDQDGDDPDDDEEFDEREAAAGDGSLTGHVIAPVGDVTTVVILTRPVK